MIQQLVKYKEFDHEEQNNKIYGVVTAVVTNTQDPEKRGRVKIKYGWLGDAKTAESNWARIATLMAGNDRGTHFLPEVDDEVLVCFEHGNINHPYIIGALYNNTDKVVEKNEDGKNNLRIIKSRSGHTITFDDTSDSEKLTIEDKSTKRSIEFDCSAKKFTIKNDEDSGAIELDAKGDIKIDSEAKITINSSSGLDLTSDGDVKLSGKNVTISSDSSMKIDSGSSLKASSSSSMSISAGSSLSAKGSSSAKVEGGSVTVKGSSSATLQGATVSVKGSGTGTFDGGGMATIKGGMVKVN